MAESYIGEIRMFGGNFAPEGWAFCDGRLLPIAGNEALFSLIGTTYGGDGQTTFALPDLRGRAPMDMGQGRGLTPRAIGELAGAETATLNADRMPAHNHAVAAASSKGTVVSPENAIWAATSDDTKYSNGNPGTTMAANALGSTGGARPHENMQPFQVISFIISLSGIYPSPS